MSTNNRFSLFPFHFLSLSVELHMVFLSKTSNPNPVSETGNTVHTIYRGKPNTDLEKVMALDCC